jgi:hypothetical protein
LNPFKIPVMGPESKAIKRFYPLTHGASRYILLLFLTLGVSELKSQSVSANLSEPVQADNFDNNNLEWPIFTNRDNFFIIQSGEYILERKNSESQYVIFSSSPKEPDSYAAAAAVKVEQGYAGLIFRVQRTGQGAFMVELSADKKYRLKQLAGSNYQLLTGDVRNEGWTKHSSLKNGYNTLTVKTDRNRTDIYINDVYITTLSDQSYSGGTIGLTIGPQSKARVDRFYLFREKSSAPETEQGARARSDSLRILNQTNLENRRIIEKLSRENDSLKGANSRFRMEIEELKAREAELTRPKIPPSHPDTVNPKSH